MIKVTVECPESESQEHNFQGCLIIGIGEDGAVVCRGYDIDTETVIKRLAGPVLGPLAMKYLKKLGG